MGMWLIFGGLLYVAFVVVVLALCGAAKLGESMYVETETECEETSLALSSAS